MAVNGAISISHPNQLLSLVEAWSGQKVSRCYQCGKCSAGCPSAYAMDLTPRQIMRAVQLGLGNEIWKSSAIWLCVSCQTCTARCPLEIDIARVMESLRLLAVAERSEAAEKEVEVFHRIFLAIARRCGRMYELGLGAAYNLLSRHFLANAALLPAMFFKGKLSLLPPRAKGVAEVRLIFSRIKALGNESSPLSTEE